MDYISDESTDISDSEMDDFEAQSYLHLKAGNLRVKVADDIYRCPFCVGKKKLVYKYKDLLQHAIGVGASNRGEKVRAKHRALEKLLKNVFADAAGQSLQPEVIEQQPSFMTKQDDQFVWPWMGILVNVREGVTKVKEQLVRFHPLKITSLWNADYHIGYAVVEFSKDWTGFKNAMAFENYFDAKQKGKMDWYRNELHGLEIFGWVARGGDYISEDPTGEYMRKRGDLKSLVDLAEEESRKMDKLVVYLTNEIQHKNELLQELECQYHQARMSLEKKSVMHQACNEASISVDQIQNAKQGGGRCALCQICDMPNHTAKHCPHRYDQSYEPEGILESMASMSLSESQH